jgi:glycosyltransferase involved in cell wall biosynthesis
MKVLISAYRCNPNKGGEELRSWIWIEYYLKEGFEVVCLTNMKDREAIEALPNLPKNLHFEYVEMPKWAERVYVNTVGVYLHYLIWQMFATKKAKELHNLFRFSFVHHTCYGSPQLGSGMWRLGIPFIYGPLGGGQFAPKALKKYFYEGWKEEVARFWASKLLMRFNTNARQALKLAKIVITENYETQQLAVKYGAQNVMMFLDAEIPIQQLVKEKRYQDKNELRILWVGRILPRKGLPLALEALSLLKDKMNFRFTIIGDGPFGKYVSKWLKHYGLEDRVDWLGQVSLDTVKEHYQNNDVLLFSSLRDSSGAQLFEAMSYGLPIVTLDQFGAKALLPENACIKVPVTSPEKTVQGIADALLLYYQNEDMRKLHGKNALEYMRTTHRKNIPELIKLLKNKLNQSSILVTR